MGEIPPPFCQEDALHCAAGASQLAGRMCKRVSILALLLKLKRNHDVHVYSEGWSGIFISVQVVIRESPQPANGRLGNSVLEPSTSGNSANQSETLRSAELIQLEAEQSIGLRTGFFYLSRQFP